MFSGRVLEVIDGKVLLVSPGWTIETDSGFLVMLDGVSTPDRTEPGGAEAKAAHEKIAVGKLITYEGSQIDPFRRLVAMVEIDGVSVNETMQELGWK